MNRVERLARFKRIEAIHERRPLKWASMQNMEILLLGISKDTILMVYLKE